MRRSVVALGVVEREIKVGQFQRGIVKVAGSHADLGNPIIDT